MRYLALDTSCGIRVLLCDNGKAYSFSDEKFKTASALLLPKVDSLLSSAHLTLSDIDCFCVVTGPGSFTGIRIAVNTARAFCQATGKKLLPLTSLQVCAYAKKSERARVVVYGWSDVCYTAEFDKTVLTKEPQVVRIDEVKDKEDVVCDRRTAEKLGIDSYVCDIDCLKEACDDLLEKGRAISYQEVTPFYLVPSQAERELAQKSGE